MAHRVAAVALLVVGVALFPIRPLVGAIVLACGVVVVLDRRGTFGRGIFRAAIGFIAGVWLGLAGVVATLLGMVALPDCDDTGTAACAPPGANILFLPGVLLLVIGLGLVGWSVVVALRARRRRQPWPTL